MSRKLSRKYGGKRTTKRTTKRSTKRTTKRTTKRSTKKQKGGELSLISMLKGIFNEETLKKTLQKNQLTNDGKIIFEEIITKVQKLNSDNIITELKGLYDLIQKLLIKQGILGLNGSNIITNIYENDITAPPVPLVPPGPRPVPPGPDDDEFV